MPFATDRLAYHPAGLHQQELYEASRAELDAAGVRAISTDDLFAGIDYRALNLGVAYGRCRIVAETDPQPPSVRDVVIFRRLPNDLTHVAGVISEEPQTPLSHVNLKAKQNRTPNAYIRDAGAPGSTISQWLGKVIRLQIDIEGFDIREADPGELEQHLAGIRPEVGQIPTRNLTVTAFERLDALRHADSSAFGAKACNLAELRRAIDPDHVPDGVAVPFYFYDRFMQENGLYDEAERIIAGAEFRADAALRDQQLKELRRAIKRGIIPADLDAELNVIHTEFKARHANPRCRSSTNNEDLEKFNGAGLYDSYTHRRDEGPISKSIKQVWASLWNYRAFEERDFYRIDHFRTAMGVLIHPNFDDEQANGVAVTRNIYFPEIEGYYVNVQAGETSVTNPVEDASPEELLIMRDATRPRQEIYDRIYFRTSNLVDADVRVLGESQLKQLRGFMKAIQEHFSKIYNSRDSGFAMDIEFKVDREGRLVIKQARPWLA